LLQDSFALGYMDESLLLLWPLSRREGGWGEGSGSPCGALCPNPHPPFGHPLPEGEGLGVGGLKQALRLHPAGYARRDRVFGTSL